MRRLLGPNRACSKRGLQGLCKRFVDIIRLVRLVRCVAVLFISIVVLFTSPLILYAQTEGASEKLKYGMALPGEKCRVEPLRGWTEPEKWVWGEICAGRNADFNKRLGEKLDPRNPKHNKKWMDGRRKLSSSFLRTILLNEPFRSAIPHRGVWIIAAYFKDEIDLRDASIQRLLALHSSLFNSPVNMSRFKTTKFISFTGSRFEGALEMDSATIGGSLLMRNAEFKQALLRGSKVGGQLLMDGSKFKGKINMDSVTIGGSLHMRDAEFKEIRLRGSKVGGQLSMLGSKFKGKLNMDSVTIGGILLMQNAEFKEIRLRGSKVGGQLSMLGSKFDGMLSMNSASVGSHLFMSKKAEFKNVDLIASKIGGGLDMKNSTFEGKLDMSSTSIEGDLLMLKAQLNRPADLSFLIINNNLDARGATLNGLDLRGARIEGELRLGLWGAKKTEWKGSSPKITLRNARVGALQDTVDSWPDNLEREFGGFIYQRLGGFATSETEMPYHRESKWFIEWLAKDKSYSPQPYRHLASVLRGAGHGEMADDILYANREREHRESGPSQLKWWFLWPLWLVIGYGYGWRYFLALGWVLLLAGVGAGFLYLKKETDYDNKRLGFWYSFDMLLPIIKLRELHYEVDLETRWVRIYFYFHKIVGYVLIFFVIAGLTGLTEWDR